MSDYIPTDRDLETAGKVVEYLHSGLFRDLEDNWDSMSDPQKGRRFSRLGALALTRYLIGAVLNRVITLTKEQQDGDAVKRSEDES